jgi:hypothetical protein
MYCLLIELQKSRAKGVLVYVAGIRLRTLSETLNQAGVRKEICPQKAKTSNVNSHNANYIFFIFQFRRGIEEKKSASV